MFYVILSSGRRLKMEIIFTYEEKILIAQFIKVILILKFNTKMKLMK